MEGADRFELASSRLFDIQEDYVKTHHILVDEYAALKEKLDELRREREYFADKAERTEKELKALKQSFTIQREKYQKHLKTCVNYRGRSSNVRNGSHSSSPARPSRREKEQGQDESAKIPEPHEKSKPTGKPQASARPQNLINGNISPIREPEQQIQSSVLRRIPLQPAPTLVASTPLPSPTPKTIKSPQKQPERKVCASRHGRRVASIDAEQEPKVTSPDRKKKSANDKPKSSASNKRERSLSPDEQFAATGKVPCQVCKRSYAGKQGLNRHLANTDCGTFFKKPATPSKGPSKKEKLTKDDETSKGSVSDRENSKSSLSSKTRSRKTKENAPKGLFSQETIGEHLAMSSSESDSEGSGAEN